MAIFIGFLLAFLVGVLARVVRLDRDRAFYPTVMLPIASYYVLFAVMGGAALLPEALIGAGFIALTVVGFRKTPWLVVAALALHGLFDLVHHHLITNPGVPPWWPGFCSAYDLTAAVFLGMLLRRASQHTKT